MLTQRAAELIKAELQKEGLHPVLYGIHNLLAVCTTTAAALEVGQLVQRKSVSKPYVATYVIRILT